MRRRQQLASITLVAVVLGAGSASARNESPLGQQPPADTAVPTISGTPVAGKTLFASTGSWFGVSLSYSYQWARCDTSGGACAPLAGEVASSHAVTNADVGSTLRTIVTATNRNGAAIATSDETELVATSLPKTSSTPTTSTTTTGDSAATTTSSSSTTPSTSTTTTTTTTTTAAAPAVTPIWDADMEEGNLSDYSGDGNGGVFNSGQGTASASTAFAHTGRYSAEKEMPSGSEVVRLTRLLVQQYGPLWYSFWEFIPYGYRWTAASTFWQFAEFKSRPAEDISPDPFWALWLIPGPNGSLEMALRNKPNDRTYYQSLVTLPVGRWFHVEMYVDPAVGTANGTIKVYQDGLLLFDLSPVAIGYQTDTMRLEYVNSNYGDGISPAPVDLYTDDSCYAPQRGCS